MGVCWYTPVTASGPYVYIIDNAVHKVREWNVASSTLATRAGTGVAGYIDAIGASAKFNRSEHCTVIKDTLYIADTGERQQSVYEVVHLLVWT